MGLHITVFTDKPVSSKQKGIVEILSNKFVVMVDAIHGKDKEWLQLNYGVNHRFFFLSEFLSMCVKDDLEGIAPDFAISFNDSDEVSARDWVCIERYIESLFVPSIRHPEHVIQKANELLDQYFIEQKSLDDPEVEAKPDQAYELRLEHVPDQDCVLIQVDKPYCDLPYTVVIRNYGEKGLKSFFTDLFIIQSWGVSRQDIAFLKHAWDHFEMEGDFDLDFMLLEATKRCFPSEGCQPDEEPEVYRRPIEEVLKTFRTEYGRKRKESDFWNAQRLKKRRDDDLLL